VGDPENRNHGEPGSGALGNPLDQIDAEQPDLALVHADDEYLDMLGGLDLDRLDGDGADGDELASLLVAWRQDIDAEPVGELVDDELAVVTVQAARIRRRRRPRLLVPIAAAAAVLAVAFAGFGLAARDAQPGDTLWALTKVLYADHARSVEAAAAVRTDLRDAEALLAEGRVDDARSRLDDAHATLPTVSNEDGQKDLEEQHASLVAQLPGNPSDNVPNPPSPNPSTSDPSGGSSDSSSSDTSVSIPSDETTSTDPTSPTETTKTISEPASGSSGGTEEGETPNGMRAEDPPATTAVPEAGS
jgi:hypothetical protein